MSNDIIKMFIGGEEVVSNQEFTITEEMLSASSTILNNCYPQSWENTKDYSSNFYFPKDYSKFILGKGNFAYGTDQYSILTVSGNTFMQFNTNIEREYAGFNVYGNGYQAPILPVEYTQVDYIESNGTQYIDTGYLLSSNNLKYEGKARITQQGNYTLWGTVRNNENGWALNPYANTGYGGNLTFWSSFSQVNGLVYSNTEVPTNTDFKITGQQNNTSATTTVNGITKTATSTVWVYPQTVTYKVFSAGDASQKAYMRLYYLKLYDNNVLVRDFIPCYRNSDNVLGLYDLVNGVFYTNAGSGTFTYGSVAVLPTPPYPIEIENVGYQNLFNPTITWENYYGVTATIENQVITLSGTSTGGVAHNIANADIDSGTYTITLDIISGTHNTNKNIYIDLMYNSTKIGGTSFKESGTKTISIASYVNMIRIGYDGADTFSDLKFKMLIIKGNLSPAFIPYGKYGIELINTGKNLLNIKNGSFVYSTKTSYEIVNQIVNYSAYDITYQGGAINLTTGITGAWASTNNQDKHLTVNGGTYTISAIRNGNISFGTNGNVYIYIIKYIDSGVKDTSQYMLLSKTQNISTKTINLANNEHIGEIVLYSQFVECEDVELKIQLEKNNQATEYEAYQSNSQLYLIDEPLRAVGNVKDELYVENNKLYLERKIKKVILNGTENWSYYAAGVYFYNSTVLADYPRSTSKKPINFISNLYADYNVVNMPSGVTDYMVLVQQPDRNSEINIRNTDFTTPTDFKNWLSSNNVEIQYVLANSTTEELGTIDLPIAYNGINNIRFYTGLETDEDVNYYWKNFDVLFAGIVKNSGDISLRPTDPKYCSLQILDYKTFLSESDTLDFVISEKTIAEAISMVVNAVKGYGFILGNINISQASDIIGAYSTLNKTAYDVFQYLANISGSRWRARFVDDSTMAIDFYDPDLLPQAADIDYTQQYWEDNNIVDLTFSYGTRDYRNKQVMLSDEVYASINYTETILSNGYDTTFLLTEKAADVLGVSVNGTLLTVATTEQKELGIDADFYYTPGNNVIESATSYSAGTQINVTYTPLVKGRQIIYNEDEIGRIVNQTNTTGIISRYESRNDVLSNAELDRIGQTYITYKGKPEIILKLTTLDNDIYNVGEVAYFNAPIEELQQQYMVKTKETQYIVINEVQHIFYTYELTSSFNSEKAINWFDNQRNKAKGNIAIGESITRNIDIENIANIIWNNVTITEVSMDGDNVLNSALNSPFVD